MSCTDNFIIEDASSGDIENIVEFFKKYRKSWKPSLDMQNNLDSYPSVKITKDGNLIGFAYCCSFAPDVLELANIYIDEAFRSNRLGTKLLGYLENKIKETNYGAIILCNSVAYEGKAEGKMACNFYIRNEYAQIAETAETKIFYKKLK